MAPPGAAGRCVAMKVFLDFEASSLGKNSYPIEVAWVFEDGQCESFLIRPADGWTDWEATAEDIHHISRSQLETEGTAHDDVARRMVAVLDGHSLFVSAPSWDGKWLSVLLRAAGLPRHALRLQDTEKAQREAVREQLGGLLTGNALKAAMGNILTHAAMMNRQPVRHRALADARQEWQLWKETARLAQEQRALLKGARHA